MLIHRAYKSELKLNNKERGLMLQCAGTARFTYNWGLARKIETYEETGKSPDAIALHRELNALKKADLSWMYNYSKTIPQEALRDLDKAYDNFFRRVKQKKEKVGFPKFKSKHGSKKSFKIWGAIKVEGKRIKLPRIGWLTLKESGYLPTNGVKILSAALSERAGRWFVSLQVREETEPIPPTGEPVGVDVGVKTLATVSNGATYDNPRALYKLEKRLSRAQRSLSRKKKGSSNRKKQVAQVAQLHYQIANIRKDSLHKASAGIVAKTKPHTDTPRIIVLEDLSVKGMVKNHRLAKAVSDSAMSELDRQIVYKSEWQLTEIQRVDRWFPSSKLCSECGNKKLFLSLSERIYHCENCGMVKGRDKNASDNLKNTASSAEF